jgi:hypothetical protein
VINWLTLLADARNSKRKDILKTAYQRLKTIQAALDNPLRVDPWSLNKYNYNKLTSLGLDLADPDYYFFLKKI